MYTRTVPKEIKDMIRSVAKDTGTDPKIVEEIYFHEFEFVAEMIKKGDKDDSATYENILVKHFGSFLSNEKHIKKLQQINHDRQVLQGE